MQHATRPIALLTILIVIAASILAGCTAMPEVVEREVTPEVVVTAEVGPTAEAEPTPEVQLRWNTEPPRVVDVISTGNETVLISFSSRMGANAQDVTRYQITRPQLCDVRDWHAQLGVTGATLSADGMSVTLTTWAQKGVTYRLVVAGVQDRAGNPLVVPDTGYQAIFAGTAPTLPEDSDGDGVSDADEQYGWAVRMILDGGTALCRDVTSDPNKQDTDGDGVKDGEEMGHGTDPRSADTDGDNLGDYDEILSFFSNPLLTDTDLDGLADGVEAQLNTSPALADTDGDGLSDLFEIATGGTNPRLADLPALSLDLYGNPSIILNMFDETTKKTLKVDTTLEQERQERVNTDNSSTKMSIENTVRLHTEVKVGTSQWPPSASAELTTDTEFKHGYFRETSSNWTQNSIADSQEKYEAEVGSRTNVRYDNGMLWVAMKVTNNSDLSFKVKDLRVIAYRMLPNGSFSAVGTLTPGKKSTEGDANQSKDTWVTESLCADPADPATCGHVLGPGGEIVLMLGADSLPAQEMKALVRNPSALMFEVGSYTLFQMDEFGVKETVNYAMLGERVIQRTGILVIDYGDGTVERHVVATNTLRNPDGSGKGLTLEEALAVAGTTDYELCADGRTLCRVKNAAAFRCDPDHAGLPIALALCPSQALAGTSSVTATAEITVTAIVTETLPKGFWVIAGSGAEFASDPDLDFKAVHLINGERINLVYMLDSDGDGIYDREEYLLGTDKRNPDSDGDGLSDYQETKEGWMVTIQGGPPYQIYSDPRFADLDRDFLTDSTEISLRTDPYGPDTDEDGISDSIDPFPTTPPCMDPAYLKLASWWDATSEAKDSYGGEPLSNNRSNGILKAETNPLDWKASVLGVSDQGNQIFRFNLASTTQSDQFIRVKDDSEPDKRFLSGREFTIAAWIYWAGNATDKSWATILAKGPPTTDTYGLYIRQDGKLQFQIYRNVHEKQWYCWFGKWCDDDAAADKAYRESTYLITEKSVIPKQVWTHVAATFGGETMRIFVNGQKVAELSTTGTWGGGAGEYKHQTTTISLVANQDPLLIGRQEINTVPDWPFRGMMDDIQFYVRMLGIEEIAQVYRLGICRGK